MPQMPKMMPESDAYAILNRTACFNTLGVPDPAKPSRALPMPDDTSALAGVRVHGLGHRLAIEMQPPTADGGLRAKNTVGEESIGFDFNWLLTPDKFKAAPDADPPATKFDASKSQHFLLKDSVFDFGGGNKLTGFGSGMTFPTGDDDKVRLGANGSILGGAGQFDGLTGIWVLMGSFEPPGDFTMNLLIRVFNPSGSLFAESLAPIEPIDNPDPDTTYLLLRCHNQQHIVQVYFSDVDKMPLPGGREAPMPNGTRNLQNLSGFACDFALGADGPRAQRSTGPHFGWHSVALTGNLGPTPPLYMGSPDSPIPFVDEEGFFFYDTGGVGIGGFSANIVAGQTIMIMPPPAGVPPYMGLNIAGGFAPVKRGSGTGFFRGVDGMVTNIGTGSLMPNLIELTYVVAFHDPDGKFRA